MPISKHLNIPIFKNMAKSTHQHANNYLNMPIYEITNMSTFKRKNMPIFKRTNMATFKHANI